MIEAYPVDTGEGGGKAGSYDLFLGTMAAFAELGFKEVARRLPRRTILRLAIEAEKKGAEQVRASN